MLSPDPFLPFWEHGYLAGKDPMKLPRSVGQYVSYRIFSKISLDFTEILNKVRGSYGSKAYEGDFYYGDQFLLWGKSRKTPK